MKTKKLLSVLLTICMMVQILPIISAGATEVTTEDFNYILNDHFDDGIVGWESAPINYGGTPTNEKLTLEIAAPESDPDVTAMHFETAGTSYNNSERPNLYYTFENPIAFEKGKNVVVKTRIMFNPTNPENTGSAAAEIKFNRPTTISVNAGLSEHSYRPYKALRITHSSVSATKETGMPSSSETLINESVSGEWLDVVFTFDGKEATRTVTLTDGTTKEYTSLEGYTVSVKTDDMDEAVTYRSSLAQTEALPYTLAGLDPTAEDFAGFTELKTINFGYYVGAAEIFVDSVQVYEVYTTEATASLENAKILNTEDIKLAFEFEKAVSELPEGAVTLKNKAGEEVAAETSFDSATNILTINPVNDLELATPYKVVVDGAAFTDHYINYTGETEFTVIAHGENGLLVNDTFNEGKLGNWFEGASTLKNNSNTTFGIVDGAMTLTTKATSNTNGVNHANMRYEFNEPLVFSDDKKVIIETKIKYTDAGADNKWLGCDFAGIQINRPADYAPLDATGQLSEQDRYLYNALKLTSGKLTTLTGSNLTGATGSIDLMPEGVTSAYDKWVTVRMVFDGVETQAPSGNLTREGFTITTQIEGEEAVTKKASIAQTEIAYTTAGYTLEKGFTSLKSITLPICFAATTFAVDYFRVYEVSNVNATVAVSSAFAADKGIEVALAGDANADVAPENAIIVKDADGNTIETTQTFNAETQTILVSGEFTENQVYTVIADKASFEKSYITVTGKTEFLTLATADGTSNIKYHVYETYANDAGEWKIGTSNVSASNQSLGFESGAMKFSQLVSAAYTSQAQSIVRYDLPEKLTFRDDAKIVVKTRIKNVASESTSGYNSVWFKVNRPDDNTLITNANIGGHEMVYNPFTAVRISPERLSVMTTADRSAAPAQGGGVIDVVNADMTDKWVDVEMVFGGKADANERREAYTVKVKSEDMTEFATYDATLSHSDNMYTAAGYDVTAADFKGFTSLDSLSLMLGVSKNDIYVDYLEVYEIASTGATASIEKTKVLNTEDVNLVFDTEADIATIPAGAVTLKDKAGNTVSATQTFDATTKTLAINPESNLRVGGIYKVNVDAAAFDSIFVTYTGETEFTFTAIGENGLLVNDTFDDGSLGNWEIGYSTVSKDAQSLSIADFSGNGAMKFSQTVSTNVTNNNHANIRNVLPEKLIFSDDKKILLKTRIMQTGTTEAGYWNGITTLDFKANRPEQVDFTFEERGNASYNIARFTPTQIAVPNLTDYTKPSDSERYDSAESLLNKWVDVEIVFDGVEKANKAGATTREGYSYSFKVDGVEVFSGRSSLYRGTGDKGLAEYTNAGYDPTAEGFNGFTGLENFVLLAYSSINDIYVDYFQVYEIENTTGYATMPKGNTVKYNEAIELKFYGVNDAFTFPTGAVTLKTSTGANVETTNTYNKETGILSVKPNADLTKGEFYKVNINATAFAPIAMEYLGSTYFTVTARDDFETDRVILDDDFNDNTTQGWAPGNAVNGYAAEVNASDGMLHVKAVGMGYGQGKEGSVTKLLGDGIELTEGKKVVIKTKVKNVTEGATWVLNLNRPEDLTNLTSNANLWGNYLLVRNSSTDITVPANKLESLPLQGLYNCYVWGYSIGEKRYNEETEKIENLETIDTVNKWVEYTITITDEEINNLHVKADVLDDDGNVVATYESSELNDATIKTAFQAYENVFGKVPGYSTLEDSEDPAKKAVMDNMFNKWLSADRLTFSTGKYDTPMEYYIDYIKVEQMDANDVETTASAALKVNGTATKNLTAGDNVIPTFTLQGNTGTMFTVISAMYVDGVLEGTPHIKTVTAENSNEFTYTEENGFIVPESGAVEIKAFVWDALDGLKPISAVEKASND